MVEDGAVNGAVQHQQQVGPVIGGHEGIEGRVDPRIEVGEALPAEEAPLGGFPGRPRVCHVGQPSLWIGGRFKGAPGTNLLQFGDRLKRWRLPSGQHQGGRFQGSRQAGADGPIEGNAGQEARLLAGLDAAQGGEGDLSFVVGHRAIFLNVGGLGVAHEVDAPSSRRVEHGRSLGA